MPSPLGHLAEISESQSHTSLPCLACGTLILTLTGANHTVRSLLDVSVQVPLGLIALDLTGVGSWGEVIDQDGGFDLCGGKG